MIKYPFYHYVLMLLITYDILLSMLEIEFEVAQTQNIYRQKNEYI